MTALPAPPAARLAALDNLRVVAMLLGLVTHGALPHTAAGAGRYPLRDCHTHAAADLVYAAVHAFRMEVFFVLAGFAAGGLAARRGAGGLFRDRAGRVALPLALAMVTVAPLMHVLFTYRILDQRNGPAEVEWAAVSAALRADLGAGPNFHLWFLYYLALFCLPLGALAAVGSRLPGRLVRAADEAFRWLLVQRWKAVALAAACLPALWATPDWRVETPQGWAVRPGPLAYYAVFFLFGAMFVRHRGLLPGYGRDWPALLLLANAAVLPAALALTTGDDLPGRKPAAALLGAAYAWLMVEGLVGLFQRFFAAASGGWAYLVGASYWCYLAGFPVQVAGQVWLADHPMPIPVKLAVVTAVTVVAVFASYEWVVRRSPVGWLVGARPPGGAPAAAPVVFSARIRVTDGARPVAERRAAPEPVEK